MYICTYIGTYCMVSTTYTYAYTCTQAHVVHMDSSIILHVNECLPHLGCPSDLNVSLPCNVSVWILFVSTLLACPTVTMYMCTWAVVMPPSHIKLQVTCTWQETCT